MTECCWFPFIQESRLPTARLLSAAPTNSNSRTRTAPQSEETGIRLTGGMNMVVENAALCSLLCLLLSLLL
ncbi:MAG: hypothetical protein P4M11_03910 [Candidatus Pacebacteria bacterium]|nr:hypothetical protein [Candidatus Paceibacterota bacterium]